MIKKTIILICIAIIKCSVCFSGNINKSQRIIKENDVLYIVENEGKFLVDKTVVTIKPISRDFSIPDDVKVLNSNALGYIDIVVPDNIDIEKYIKKLRDTKAYETVEFNTIGKYCYAPNDTCSSYQWYLNAINMFKAWNITTGDSIIKIAIIDSGTDTNHLDLGYGYDGYTTMDMSNAWNYETNSSNVITTNFHGTFVTGIAGAKTNNNIGIAGVSGGNNAAGTKIIPYCIGTTSPLSSFLDDAIIDAVDKGAKVINLSLELPSNTAIDAAIEYAYYHNVSIVCASGNGYSSTISYPASHEKTIAVGALNSASHRADFSNYGNGLNLMALGSDIYSTKLSNSYGYSSGTSFAAPQVTGCIALMLSLNANLSSSGIINILESTAKKISGYSYNADGWNQEVGYGLLDVYEALLQVLNLSISGSSHPCDTPVYSVTNLPTGYSVDWSLSPDVSILGTSILTTDMPQQNQCTIASHDIVPWATTLRADVKNAAGDTIVTLGKQISNTFDVTFKQWGRTVGGVTYPSIGPATVSSTETIAVNHLCDVDIMSPYFDNMTISHSGATPSYFNEFNGVINFRFPTVASTQYMTITGRDGCRIMQLNVQVIPNPNIPIPMLEVSPTADGYEILLAYEGDADVVGEMNRSLQDAVWELNIIHAASGETVQRLRVKGNRTTVSTTGWSRGVYALQAFVDGQKATKKLVVK